MPAPSTSSAATPPRDKLGLALAGGGFRAALFHLGVLRRMAELDLLRHVEVLSTVSGGSILGALYILLLKRRLDAKGGLARDEYVEVVAELHDNLVRGIQTNLRTRLFMNPFGILRVLLTEHTLGRRMSRLYERYLYRDSVERLAPGAPRKAWRPGKIALRDVRMRPGGDPVSRGHEAHNADPETISKIPSLILNATSLNSGCPFRFSSVEIGDPRLGFFRYDEIDRELMPRKRLLQQSPWPELRGALDVDRKNELVLYAAWWRARRETIPPPVAPPILSALPLLPGPLADADYGPLRRAKVAAWFIRRGPNQSVPVDGGVSPDVHLARFWEAIETISEDYADALRTAVAADRTLEAQLLDFVLHLYYLRTAEVMSPRLKRDFEALTLSEAVGASACFPPVFPPFVLLGIYDDLWVARLGLSDGGVYDNVGVMTLLDEGCNYIVASDTSGLLDVQQRVSGGRLGMMARIPSILMDDVAGLQRALLRQRRRTAMAARDAGMTPASGQVADQLRGLAFFHINSPPLPGPGLELGLDRRLLSHVRTDLDAFGDVEIDALVNHGYDTADRYLRKYLTDSPYGKAAAHWEPATTTPAPIDRDDARVRRVLDVGRSRFFRALKLGAVVSWLATLLALGTVIGSTWGVHVSLRETVLAISASVVGALERTAPRVGPAIVDRPVSLGLSIGCVLIAVVAARWLWPRVIARFRHRHWTALRRFAFATKWTRSYLGNVLWLVGGAPAWIAIGGAVVAWGSYAFFHLPFLAKTRTRT